MAFFHPRICLFLALLLLPACAFQQKVNGLAQGLETGSTEDTLEALRELDPPGRDRARYLMNLGTLELITGDFESSIASLQEAKALLAELQAISVSETFAAGTVNETIRSYDSAPNERVLLAELLVLNYLLQGDLDGARVEVLQADVLMRELSDSESFQAELASMHFLSGVVYEMKGELDDAMISYRIAAEILSAREQQIPAALRDSLLLLSRARGAQAEYRDYVETFDHELPPLEAAGAQLITFYWDGVVTSKSQHFITVYVPSLKQNVSLALPYYPPAAYLPSPLQVDTDHRSLSTELLEDIEMLAREDLDSEAGLIYTMALARILAKYQVVDAVQQQNDFAGMVANLTAMLTEVADTRSWNMLPSTIQVARVALPPGEVRFRFHNSHSDPQGEAVQDDESVLQLDAGTFTVVLASSIGSIGERIFSYTLEP